MANSNQRTAKAAEYYVAAELSRRGMIVSFPEAGAPGFDLMTCRQDGTHPISIQVKSKQDRSREWVLGKKAEELVDERLLYVFVSLDCERIPEFHIVRSSEFAAFAAQYHRDFLSRRNSRGEPNKDTSMRKFLDKDGLYLGRWDDIGDAIPLEV